MDPVLLLEQFLSPEMKILNTIVKTNTASSKFGAELINNDIIITLFDSNNNIREDTIKIKQDTFLKEFEITKQFINNNINRKELSSQSFNTSYMIPIVTELILIHKGLESNHGFWKWYKVTREVNDSLISKYKVDFLNLEENLTLDIEILQVIDTRVLEALLKDVKFIQLNQQNKNIFSDVIYAYMEYLYYFDEDRRFDYDFQEQTLIINNNLIKISDDMVIKKQPLKRESYTQSSYYARNISTTKEALIKADYKCEINPDHTTFTSPISNNNFVEGHHLIPIAYQSLFDNSIDVTANIVSLCPNCHRLVHHAKQEEIVEAISLLYEKRKYRLSKTGTDISLEELVTLYK